MIADLKELLDGLKTRPYVTGYKPRTSNYPSSASVQYKTSDGRVITEGACLRQEWYDWKGFGRTLSVGARSARIERILEAGSFYENMFREEFKRAGLWVGEEIPFFIPEIKLSGRIDAFIKDPLKAPPAPQRPKPEHLIGVELKTVGGYFGCKGPIISTKDTPLKPKVENVLQCLCYLKYYGQFGIKKWLLIYVDRGLGSSESQPTHWNCHTVEIDKDGHPVISNEQGTTTWTHFTVDDVFKRYKDLLKYLDTNSLPPRDYIMQYSNEEIARMYRDGELSKTDATAVERFGRSVNKPLDNITEEDGNILIKGDWRCRFCDFSEVCYSDKPDQLPTAQKQATKVVAPKPTDEPTEVDDLV